MTLEEFETLLGDRIAAIADGLSNPEVTRATIRDVRALLRMERERCAKIASHYSFGKPRLHPDVSWEDTNESARSACHITSQEIAALIRKPV